MSAPRDGNITEALRAMFAPRDGNITEARREAQEESQPIITRFLRKYIRNFKLKRTIKRFRQFKQNSQKRKVKRFLLSILEKQILINNRNKIFQYVNYLKKYYGYQFIYKNNYNYWKSFYKKKLQLRIEYYNNDIKTQFLKNIFDVNLSNDLINYNSDKIEKPKKYCEVLYCLEPKLLKFRVCKKHKCVVKSCPFVKHRKTIDHKVDTLLSNYKPNLEKFQFINDNYTDIIKHLKRKPLTYLKEGIFNIYNDKELEIEKDDDTIILPRHFYLEITKDKVQKNNFFNEDFVYKITKHTLKTNVPELRGIINSLFGEREETILKNIQNIYQNTVVYLDNEGDEISYNMYEYDEKLKKFKFQYYDESREDYVLDDNYGLNKSLEFKVIKNIIDILFYKLNGSIGFNLKEFLNKRYQDFYTIFEKLGETYKDDALSVREIFYTNRFILDGMEFDYYINNDGDKIKEAELVDGAIFILNDKLRQIFYDEAQDNTINNFFETITILNDAFSKQKSLMKKLKNDFIESVENNKLQVIYTICFDLIFDYINYIAIEMLHVFIKTWTSSLQYTYTFKISYYDKDILKTIEIPFLKNQRDVWNDYMIIDKTFYKTSKLNTIRNFKLQDYSNLYIDKVMNDVYINNFNNVVTLNLSKNSLKDIKFLKNNDNQFKNLETLDLSFNNLNEFEIDLDKFDNLKTIYCQNNNIYDIRIHRNINKIKNNSVKNIFINFENNNIYYVSISGLTELENRFKFKTSNDKKKKVNLAKFVGVFVNKDTTYTYNEVEENGDVYVNLYMNLNNNNLTFEEVYKLLFSYYTSAYIYGNKVLGKSQFLPIIFTCENNNKITAENKIFIKNQIEYYLNNVENSAIFKQKEVGKLLNFIRKSEETYNIKDNEKVVPFKNGLFSNFNKSKSLKLNTSKGFNYCIRHMRVALKEQPEFFDINNNLKFFTLKDIFSNKFDDYYKINIILDYMMKYNRIEEDELERKYKNDVEWYKKYKKQINEFIFTYLN